jgi:hypothetical protein
VEPCHWAHGSTKNWKNEHHWPDEGYQETQTERPFAQASLISPFPATNTASTSGTSIPISFLNFFSLPITSLKRPISFRTLTFKVSSLDSQIHHLAQPLVTMHTKLNNHPPHISKRLQPKQHSLHRFRIDPARMHIKRDIPTPFQLNHEMLPRNLVIFMTRREIVINRLRQHPSIKGLPQKTQYVLLLVHVDISSALLLPHETLLLTKSRDSRQVRESVALVGKAELDFGIERPRTAS